MELKIFVAPKTTADSLEVGILGVIHKIPSASPEFEIQEPCYDGFPSLPFLYLFKEPCYVHSPGLKIIKEIRFKSKQMVSTSFFDHFRFPDHLKPSSRLTSMACDG